MGYNIIDILEKAINIENRRKIIIINAITENQVIPAIKLISKVICNQIDEIVNYYEELKEEIKNTELEEIDFRTYDKMSFLINQYNERIYELEMTNVKYYLKSSLDLTKNKYSLFIDIQGRLVNNTSDTSTKTYEILSKIIANIKNQITIIEKTII